MKKINASLGVLSLLLLTPGYILPSNPELVKQTEVTHPSVKPILHELLENAENVFFTEKKYHIHGPQGLLLEGTLMELLKSLDASYVEEFTRRKAQLLSIKQILNSPQKQTTVGWEQAQCTALFLLAQPISERKTELAPAITNTIEYYGRSISEKFDSIITFAEEFITTHKAEIEQFFAELELKTKNSFAEKKTLWNSLEESFITTPQEQRTFKWKSSTFEALCNIYPFFLQIKTNVKLNLRVIQIYLSYFEDHVRPRKINSHNAPSTNQPTSLIDLEQRFIVRHKAEIDQTFLGSIFNLKMNQQKGSVNHLEASTVEEASTSVQHRRGKDIDSGEQSNCGVM